MNLFYKLHHDIPRKHTIDLVNIIKSKITAVELHIDEEIEIDQIHQG